MPTIHGVAIIGVTLWPPAQGDTTPSDATEGLILLKIEYSFFPSIYPIPF